jgi:hypothetical protein
MGAKLQVDHRMTVLISEMTSRMNLNTNIRKSLGLRMGKRVNPLRH